MWDEFIKQVVVWLKNELKESKTDGFVLGLSGGVDSAVCATLIKKATDNCLGLILPIKSSVMELDNAQEFASSIGLKTNYIDLTGVYKNIIKFLPDNNKIALGNLKARLRMMVIYYYANINNFLVCGTGNKTELTLGYFTKYGDGGCDILPIGDLYKTEVWEFARALNIPEKIIAKTPTADLWEGQTDKEEIGFSYNEIDESLQKIVVGKIEGEIGKKLYEMNKQSEHKRRPPSVFKFQFNWSI